MADKKISALPAGATLPTGSLIPFVDTTGSPFVTKHINWADAQVTTIAYPALQVLISGGDLIPGMIYKITGFNKNMPIGGPTNPNGFLPTSLYDDGTNSGITIYMQALSATELADSGYGEFYNPKYDLDVNTYYNLDGTGLYKIWDGNNPEGYIPTYVVNDVVFWGGYAWRNKLGNVGSAINSITLNTADWLKLPYSNATYYTKVVDEIKVDWQFGVVTERTNSAYNISVKWSLSCYATLSYYDLRINPISVIPWGLYGGTTVNNYQFGMSSLTVNDGYVDLINFKGVSLTNNYFGTESTVYGNYFGVDTYILQNLINSNSTLINNTFTYVNFTYNTLENLSAIQANLAIGYSNVTLFNKNKLYNSSINNNVLDVNGYLENNNLSFSSISGNDFFSGGRISNNILTDNSTIADNIINFASSVTGNIMHVSSLNQCVISGNSSINDNKFEDVDANENTIYSSSYIRNNQCSHSDFYNNELNNSSTIEYNVLQSNSTINANILINSSKIRWNSLAGVSSLDTNTLSNLSEISNNSLNYAYIYINSLNSSSRIGGNSCSTSNIYQCTINNNSVINNNSLSASNISDCNFSNGGFYGSILSQTSFNFSASSVIISKYIYNVSANGYVLFVAPPNFALATYLFQGGSKNVFVSSDSRPLISFIDSGNNLQIFDIDA